VLAAGGAGWPAARGAGLQDGSGGGEDSLAGGFPASRNLVRAGEIGAARVACRLRGTCGQREAHLEVAQETSRRREFPGGGGTGGLQEVAVLALGGVHTGRKVHLHFYLFFICFNFFHSFHKRTIAHTMKEGYFPTFFVVFLLKLNIRTSCSKGFVLNVIVIVYLPRINMCTSRSYC
jgi:hypothetical protein